MFVTDLATTVEQYPQTAELAFSRFEQAVNLVLPGNDIHKRYIGVESVGLATAIGRYFVRTGYYNPFEPDVMSRVSFLADNKGRDPKLWVPLETDARILGGELPEGMGRFTAFALAKINTLTDHNSGKSSFREGEVALERGMVGFAGGRRMSGSLLSLSGLWEVHDHALGEIYFDEIVRENRATPAPRTVDEIAESVEATIGAIQLLHAGTEASELSRKEIETILAVIGY